jgi:hypothetical protein
MPCSDHSFCSRNHASSVELCSCSSVQMAGAMLELSIAKSRSYRRTLVHPKAVTELPDFKTWAKLCWWADSVMICWTQKTEGKERPPKTSSESLSMKFAMSWIAFVMDEFTMRCSISAVETTQNGSDGLYKTNQFELFMGLTFPEFVELLRAGPDWISSGKCRTRLFRQWSSITEQWRVIAIWRVSCEDYLSKPKQALLFSSAIAQKSCDWHWWSLIRDLCFFHALIWFSEHKSHLSHRSFQAPILELWHNSCEIHRILPVISSFLASCWHS